jgi:hypothetical protein
MIELVFVYCLATDSTSCVERRDPFENWANPVACMMTAQQKAQEYLELHPKMRLQSWRCEVNLPRQGRA